MDLQVRMINLDNGNKVGVGEIEEKTLVYFYNKETDKELYFTLSKEATQALLQLLFNGVTLV